jgi:23S rRNA (adenine2503-C2)-methyltransferase
MENMINLKDFEFKELENFIVELGEPKFRAKQIFSWLYKGVESLREMTNIPVSLIEKLEEAGAVVSTMKIEAVQESKLDGTRKYLFKLSDGNYIESVFMKYKYGNTICVSSQAGCRMGCKFCASTLEGLQRNLTPGEISEQLLAAQRNTGENINHIVLMGTGEPFDNYENISKFLRIINDKNGKNLSLRNITVSTCGIVPKIKQFAEDFPQVNLAISLHAPNDQIRQSMMPISKRYSISELLGACKYYIDKTSRRITFEYTLVKGVNDSLENARELCSQLRGMLCHVNLIPLNKVAETGLDTTGKKFVDDFKNYLEKNGIQVTVRRELGDDIDGACGQLRLGRGDRKI